MRLCRARAMEQQHLVRLASSLVRPHIGFSTVHVAASQAHPSSSSMLAKGKAAMEPKAGTAGISRVNGMETFEQRASAQLSDNWANPRAAPVEGRSGAATARVQALPRPPGCERTARRTRMQYQRSGSPTESTSKSPACCLIALSQALVLMTSAPGPGGPSGSH